MSPPTTSTLRIERLEASKHKAGRVLIFLEDGTLLKGSEREILDFSLRAGDELDEETLARLKAACGTAGTKARAADLINRRAMSRSDLEKKLRDRGAGEGDIRYAAEWLEAIGALNDQDFAAMLARSCAQRFYGPARFREELRRHGIDRALWEEAESLLPPEEEIIENYLRAKVRVPPADERERKRLSDSLARRGFSWGAVKSALRRFGAGVEDEF